jgi:hypothetical protein
MQKNMAHGVPSFNSAPSRRGFLTGSAKVFLTAAVVTVPAVVAKAAEPQMLADLDLDELRFIMIYRRMDERQKSMTIDMLDTLTRGRG